MVRVGIIPANVVQEWKPGRRRSRVANIISRDMVLSGEELELLLAAAEREAPTHYTLFLFLSDTGARFGEATAPQVMLDTYTHFLPTELSGFADSLAAPNGTIRHQPTAVSRASTSATKRTPAVPRSSLVSAPGLEPGTGGLRVRCSAN